MMEMLLALALTAALMAALAGLIGDAARAAQAVEADDGGPGWIGRAAAAIERDIDRASRVWVDEDDALAMELRVWNDRAGRHEPVRVAYTLMGDDDLRWLVRREEKLAALVNTNVHLNAVGYGLSGFEARFPDETDLSEDDAGRRLLTLVFASPGGDQVREVLLP